MRSYFIFGIYSLMVAAFYRWEASLFVLMAAIFMEMILLYIGSWLIPNKNRHSNKTVGRTGAAYALFASIGLVYPLAYMLGDAYNEYTIPPDWGYFQPVVDYKWQILLMALTLGIGYLVDFKKLRQMDPEVYLTKEVYRVCFLLFGIGLVGMMCLEGIEEVAPKFYDAYGHKLSPYTTENKMIPVFLMIAMRMVIEAWYMIQQGRAEKNNVT